MNVENISNRTRGLSSLSGVVCPGKLNITLKSAAATSPQTLHLTRSNCGRVRVGVRGLQKLALTTDYVKLKRPPMLQT